MTTAAMTMNASECCSGPCANWLKHFENRHGIKYRFGYERTLLDIFRQLGTVGVSLRAMIVVPPWTQSIERGNSVPNQVAVAQTSALLKAHRNAQRFSSLLPEVVQGICLGVARPGAAFMDDFHFDLARIFVDRTSHLSGPSQSQQGGLGSLINFRFEVAQLTFGNRFVWNAVQDGAAADRRDINGQFIGIVRERGYVLDRLT